MCSSLPFGSPAAGGWVAGSSGLSAATVPALFCIIGHQAQHIGEQATGFEMIAKLNKQLAQRHPIDFFDLELLRCLAQLGPQIVVGLARLATQSLNPFALLA